MGIRTTNIGHGHGHQHVTPSDHRDSGKMVPAWSPTSLIPAMALIPAANMSQTRIARLMMVHLEQRLAMIRRIHQRRYPIGRIRIQQVPSKRLS